MLNWWPRYAEVAASGSFGYTCGPWTFQPATTADPVPANGDFFTVWQKNKSGEWKFILDVGTGTGPAWEDASLIAEQAGTKRGVEITMLEAESDFIRLFKMDPVRACQLFIAEKSLRAREGTGLVKNEKQQPESHPETAGLTRFPALGSGMAYSGDLGYVYGTALLNEKMMRTCASGGTSRGWKLPCR